MHYLRRTLRWGFAAPEALLDRCFGPAWNPLYHLGALGFFYYWIVVVSGIYLYIFFDTGTTAAYRSIEYITYEQWYLAGVMRSLHRYASDGMVLFMGVHILREFSLDRHRGARWFTWVTGVPILWLIYASGITGYWLVWDKLAQYVAIVTAEWFDYLPIFGDSVARNFLSTEHLDDRFFTLMIFVHIAVPLFLLLVLWLHLQRLSRPRINPARGLAVGTFVMLVALSFILPAESQGPADLARVPAVVKLDWFYLGMYPLLDVFSNGTVWATAGVITLMLSALPWLPPLRRVRPAVVDLDNCNGCARCVEDCPYVAVSLRIRSDGKPFEHEAVVDPALCVACGICAGACPTSMPFRRASELVPGIDLPQLPMKELRRRLHEAGERLKGDGRVIVFGCDEGLGRGVSGPGIATIGVPCVGMVPPAFLDYALSRHLADGVALLGCGEENCIHRFGLRWTDARLAGERDPRLRANVARERILKLWTGPLDRGRAARELAGFAERLRRLGPLPAARRPKQREAVDA
jgi:ferredoxin/coenzyme F420-reducing hydrogenase delta subunit